jgi:hypothetical protein
VNGLREESGAVAVMTAVFFAFVTLGIGALAVDGGSLWASQRSLVTNSDAMAHAGAVFATEHLKQTGLCPSADQVRAEADRLRGLNDPDDVIEGFAFRCDQARQKGLVQVRTRQASDRYFAPTDDLSAAGTSAFDFTPRRRPATGWTVCENLFKDPLALDKFELTDGVYALPYTKAADTLLSNGVAACPSSGNWSGANEAPGAWGWLPEGCDSGDEGEELVDFPCQGNVGNDELKRLFGDLDEEGRRMYLPIFSTATGNGNAQRNPATFQIVGMVEVTLLGDCNTNSDPDPKTACTAPYEQKFTGQANFLIFQFHRINSVGFFATGGNSRALYDGHRISQCDVDTTLVHCRT